MNIQEIKQHLPDTRARLFDNLFTDEGDGFSWNFNVDGHKATLGYLRPGFDLQFPAGEGGELITLINPDDGDELRVDILDENGEVETGQTLTQEGESIFVEEGRILQATVPTSVSKIIEYVCEYPGQPSEQ